MESRIIDSVGIVLENSPAADQAKHLHVDHLGNRQGCAFCECAGFDCAIFHWTTRQDDPIWPKAVGELRHGLCLADLDGPWLLAPSTVSRPALEAAQVWAMLGLGCKPAGVGQEGRRRGLAATLPFGV